ncbi:MAG: LLM class flavin-dependent oxidoreductase [Nitrososphaerales archaeon]
MQFGLSFGALYAPSEQIVKLAIEAEKYGFSHLWLPDSQMIYRDVYMNLALTAKATSKVKLGTLVTSPATRHPSVIASAAVTLNEISGGRAIIGIGAGDSAVRRIGLPPETTSRVAETIKIIRKLCLGEPVDFKGIRSTLRYGGVQIPIYVVATGHKMLAMGGALSDGVVIHSGTSQSLIDSSLRAVEKGASEAKRSLGEIDLVHMGFCSIAEEREAAYALVKPSVIWFCIRYPNLLEEAGLPLSEELAEDVERFRSDYASYDFIHSGEWGRAMDATAFLPDRFAAELAYSGTPEDVVKKIRAVEAKGFTQVIIRPPSTEHWEQVFRMFAEHVIPYFK